jgi:predicted DCC family thiol-disulfide oxidoreductase YuxK
MKECIVLFDGECNLCNGTVQFIIKNDPRLHFCFAALQSEKGKALLAEHGLQQVQIDSVVLIVADKAWLKSDAALRIARNLSGLWPLCFVAVIIPRPWRDHIYDFIARNRYKWFGKQESCWLPTPELRQRFLS